MSGLTQLQRAQLVAAKFQPKDPPGSAYVYVFCGQASWDASGYKVIDDQVFMSKRIWHVTESRTDCVSYAGQGCNGRINDTYTHSILPSPDLRLKLREHLSINDSIELERLIIEELGCICDAARSDGCLVNLRRFQSGPLVCKPLEAHAYLNKQAGLKGGAAAAAATAVDVIAMTVDRAVVARGSASELARQFSFSNGDIIKCCRNKACGIWQSSESRPIYFCYADNYFTYKIKPMTNIRAQAHRLMIAKKIDGSDICCGTASEIARYAPEIKRAGDLHSAACGKRKSIYGWNVRYANDLEAPAETIPPTPYNFY